MAPAAVGQLIGALESLWTIRDFGEGHILQGRSQYREPSPIPRTLRRRLDSRAGAVALQVATIIGATIVLTSPGRRSQQIVGSAILFVAKKTTEMRSPYGGDGADQMSDVVAGYRLLTAPILDKDRADDLFLRAVNAQLTISYVASGLAKLLGTTWRSGEAVNLVLQPRQYGTSRAAALLRNAPAAARLLSWFTIAWETLYPIVYPLPTAPARAVLLGVKGFHFGIAFSMGLPRFLWSFSSAHAAAEYVLTRRAAQ